MTINTFFFIINTSYRSAVRAKACRPLAGSSASWTSSCDEQFESLSPPQLFMRWTVLPERTDTHVNLSVGWVSPQHKQARTCTHRHGWVVLVVLSKGNSFFKSSQSVHLQSAPRLTWGLSHYLTEKQRQSSNRSLFFCFNFGNPVDRVSF